MERPCVQGAHEAVLCVSVMGLVVWTTCLTAKRHRLYHRSCQNRDEQTSRIRAEVRLPKAVS
jgi:hypothetical protein